MEENPCHKATENGLTFKVYKHEAQYIKTNKQTIQSQNGWKT